MGIKPRTLLTTDEQGLPEFQVMNENKAHFNFGDKVGLMVFRAWYPCISDPKHFANSQAYNFPVRLGYVDDPFNLDNIVNDGASNAWNLENWIACAQQLEEDGCKALVGGCGLTAMMQSQLAAAVTIPVYSSTMLFFPFLLSTLASDKKIAVLTVNENSLNMNNGSLFDECGIDKSRMVIQGMDQSSHADDWSTQFNDVDYSKDRVENAIVSVATALIENNPDVGQIILECTEMPPFADAIRKATQLPVFDAVDMTKMVYNLVR
ncbi:hypothetical protein [Vibrio comitans]|uniref:Asp/Glu/hydantoin racemase n=1 Tax=Vibrio comitans NBRC 102076 TaxID=1219078 RepID=A0A4Y3IHW6_9VIBR|nr:hypothetical protein [Vibrio comitans]GEA59007.1 hypothetical protein VCO01S_02000 [Vibrio comitans NBRC 102076]